MAFDAHKNFAISTVVTAPSPATSGTTLVVTTGEGARFPAVPFNATVCAAGQIPTPGTAEVVRVTARSSDTLTVTRAQESSTARSIITGDYIAATISAKTITDLESGTNFPLITTGSCTVSDLTAAASGYINFYTASGLVGRIHASGAFSWGGTYDAGTSAIVVGPAGGVGTAFVLLHPSGLLNIGVPGTGTSTMTNFINANGVVGKISTSGTSTDYQTSSDARQKQDRGRYTDLDVLRRSVIHAFDWLVDGTPGRGVFAQEAVTVAPFAVTPGTDDRDEAGRLTQPWGVDYSKYVPDLIVGWQAHEAQVAALEARVAALEARLTAGG